jgi:hypothetical protein
MPDRSLDSLSSDFYPLACEWIARVTARGIAVMVIQTSRTMAEHRANLANGTSGTDLSLHLPRLIRWRSDLAILQPADGPKADAMDIAPFEQYQLHGPDKLKWDPSDPAWGVIGEEAERVGRAGLRWGGRWMTPFDPGHGEFVLPWKVQYLTVERARPWPLFV